MHTRCTLSALLFSYFFLKEARGKQTKHFKAPLLWGELPSALPSALPSTARVRLGDLSSSDLAALHAWPNWPICLAPYSLARMIILFGRLLWLATLTGTWLATLADYFDWLL